MGTVTIAATYGAGGSVVAPAVAERLNLPLIDRAIPIALAESLAHEGELAEDEVRDTGRVARYLAQAVSLSGLYVGVPVPPEARGADDRIAQTEEVLRRAANAGGAVVLGRAGVFVLRNRADVLQVRLDGRPEARMRQAMEHEHLDEETAERMLRDNDRARAAYIHTFYPGERWEDPLNYHLVLDSTALPLEVCVNLIVSAAAGLGFGEGAKTPQRAGRR
jgi:cytidylate kinase